MMAQRLTGTLAVIQRLPAVLVNCSYWLPDTVPFAAAQSDMVGSLMRPQFLMAVFSEWKKLSIGALSQQFPLRLMLWRIPCFLIRSR